MIFVFMAERVATVTVKAFKVELVMFLVYVKMGMLMFCVCKHYIVQQFSFVQTRQHNIQFFGVAEVDLT